MKTYVYVDGFNLYYRALKDTPYRWLDLSALCRLLLPNDRVEYIKYFTAKVKWRANELDQPNRQQLYLRALRTIPNLTVIYGRFLSHNVTMPLTPPEKGYARVI